MEPRSPTSASRRALAAVLLIGAGALAAFLLRAPGGKPPADAVRSVAPADGTTGPALVGLARGPEEPPSEDARSGAMTPAPPEEARARPADSPGHRSVHGTLLDPDGTPARTGRVVAVGHAEFGPREVYWRKEAHADRTGRFEVAVPDGDRARLVGWSQSAAPTYVECGVGSDGSLGEVRLARGAALSGVLLAPAASRLAGDVRLRASRLDAHDGAWTWHVSQVARVATLEDGRCVSAWIETKADGAGRWRIEGLTPGEYAVELVDIGAATVHAGLQQRLRVSATAPATGVEIALSCSIVELKPPPPTPPEQNALPLEATLTDEAGTSTRLDYMLVADWELTRIHRMVVAPGARYRVGLAAHGYHAKVVEVRAPPAGEELEVPVALERTGRGTLRVLPPEGREGEATDVWLELNDPTSGDEVHSGSLTSAAGERATITLAEGRWTLVLRTDFPLNRSAEGWDLPESVAIEIQDGRETTHRRRPPQGGRFAVQVTCADERPRTYALRLLREGRDPQLVSMTWADPEPGKYAWSASLECGRTYTTLAPQPPGDVELELLAEGCVPQRLPARLESGVTTQVRAVLTPR